MHYIEGGWPGSNPKDLRFFRRMQDVSFKHAKLAAFSMTRRAGAQAENDANMQALLEAGAPVATIVGKSWDFHVTEALGTTLPENLAMIADTIAFLRSRTEEVLFDAEHFFDGFRANRDYALATLKAAEDAGAHWLILCDTNGGTLPFDLVEIIRAVKQHLRAPLGIHVHNDAECAVANSLAAVREGVGQVQGTVNGYGERCGNANLVSIIPSLVLKMGLDCIPENNLRELRSVSRFASELANRKPWDAQPYVGDSAFAHKGGMHVSAVLKHPETYEHLDPEADWQPSPRARLGAERQVQRPLEGARVRHRPRPRDAGLAQDPRSAQGPRGPGLPVRGRGGVVRDPDGAGPGPSPALFPARGLPGDRGGAEHRAGAGGRGDRPRAREGRPRAHRGRGQRPGRTPSTTRSARRSRSSIPVSRALKLLDYKVRILDESKGTGAKTRVLITSGDGEETWGTVGVADNIIEASWQALVDSIEYKLRRDDRRARA